MTLQNAQSDPIAETIEVTRETMRRATRGLPSPVRFAIGYALDIRRGALRIQLPDGRKLMFRGAEDGPEADMIVRDYAFARRLALRGDLGFAEGFIRNEWDSQQLADFLFFFCSNHEAVSLLLRHNPLTRLIQVIQHQMNRNTKARARRNIMAHYDLGNAFYAAWLDPTMTYSSGYYGRGAVTLDEAQEAKYRLLAEAIRLKAGDHVLEIGCGWGSFAAFAATQYGARVTALTISQEQFTLANRRIADLGLSDRVTVKLQDYRDERGTYDAIASIEMFEAVGREYWSTFFDQAAGRLKTGGRAGMQIITIAERLWGFYMQEIDFIRGYIFPGGMLPTRTHLIDIPQASGLRIDEEVAFGADYARTLRIWHDRFQSRWEEIAQLGFDERFRRLWTYYLAYCEAGFRSGMIDVRQLTYVKA